MTSPNIRLASQKDLTDLTALQAVLADEIGATALSSDEMNRLALCGPGARALIARDETGSATGYALLILQTEPTGGRSYDVAHLFVDPNRRSRGIGRALLSSAQALTEAEGRTRLTIGTPPQPVARLRLTAVY